jgi:sulfur-carrier protein
MEITPINEPGARMTVQMFGMIAELFQADHLLCELPEGTLVADLRRHLAELNPGLTDMQYAVAIDLQVVDDNTPIPASADIAVLPPFAGG